MPDDLDFRSLAVLVENPREEMHIELKGWLDLRNDSDHGSDLAKAILAIANHGGGFVLLGFDETEGAWAPSPNRPATLDGYSQDIVNQLVARYAEPSFHCNVHHVSRPSDGLRHPVVVVPGEHRVPIRSNSTTKSEKHVKNNKYYIRKPGPKSEEILTGAEWEELIGKCVRRHREDLVDRIRDVILGIAMPARDPEQPKPEDETRDRLAEWIKASRDKFNGKISYELKDEPPNRYSHGLWTAAYGVVGMAKQIPLSDLVSLLVEVDGHETGWSPWHVFNKNTLAPYPMNGAIECWVHDGEQIFNDGAHSDFWRVSPTGVLYLSRGYAEDTLAPSIEPGTVIDVSKPIWETGECLLHASRFAARVAGNDAAVVFYSSWEKLTGRRLTSVTRQRIPDLTYDAHRSRQDTVESTIVASVRQIETNLTELVRTLTAPLYEAFDFFKPSVEFIDAEIGRLKGRAG